MTSDILIRDAHDDERDMVRDLTLRAYGEYASIMTVDAWIVLEGAIRAALASGARAHRLVAEQDGVIVGSVMLFPPATAAYGELAKAEQWPELRLLAVAPQARGLGIGERLVRECIDRARQDGQREIGLHTSVSMQGAMKLYERMGFVRAPESDFQPPGAEVVCGYRLSVDATRPIN